MMFSSYSPVTSLLSTGSGGLGLWSRLKGAWPFGRGTYTQENHKQAAAQGYSLHDAEWVTPEEGLTLTRQQLEQQLTVKKQATDLQTQINVALHKWQREQNAQRESLENQIQLLQESLTVLTRNSQKQPKAPALPNTESLVAQLAAAHEALRQHDENSAARTEAKRFELENPLQPAETTTPTS